MLVALDGVAAGVVAGVVAAADLLKDDSVEAVKALRQLGLDVVMLTGDARRTAQAVAERVGITSVLAEVRPEDKAAEIARLQAGAGGLGWSTPASTTPPPWREPTWASPSGPGPTSPSRPPTSP